MIRFPAYIAAICLAAFAPVAVSAAGNPATYHVTKTVTLGIARTVGLSGL